MSGLPPLELGYAHTELRRELVDAVLRGEKTATAGLLASYEAESEEPERIGSRCALLGFDGEPVAVVEITESRVVPAAEIDEEFARDEGEGYDSVEEWRSAHERFFDRPIGQDTPIVAVRFRVVEQL
jgi:uncharacterized protein YhfF